MMLTNDEVVSLLMEYGYGAWAAKAIEIDLSRMMVSGNRIILTEENIKNTYVKYTSIQKAMFQMPSFLNKYIINYESLSLEIIARKIV